MVILILIISITILYFVFLNSNPKQEPNEENTENYVQVLENGVKQNTSSKLAETKQINGLELTEISLTEVNNMTHLVGTITNTTNEKLEEQKINITLINKEGEILTTLETYVKSLEPGESTTLSTSTTFDYSNAYDVKITK